MNQQPVQLPVPGLASLGRPAPQPVQIPIAVSFTFAINLTTEDLRRPQDVARGVRRLQQAIQQLVSGQEVGD